MDPVGSTPPNPEPGSGVGPPSVDDSGFDITVRVHQQHGVVSLAGELDVAAAPRLGEALQSLLEHDCRQILMDLSAVTFLDSSGLAELIRANQTLRRQGRHMHLHHPPRAVLRLLDMTGVTGEFDIE